MQYGSILPSNPYIYTNFQIRCYISGFNVIAIVLPPLLCRIELTNMPPPVNFTLIRGIFVGRTVYEVFFWKGKPVIGSNFSSGVEAGCVIKALKSGDSLELLLLGFVVQNGSWPDGIFATS